MIEGRRFKYDRGTTETAPTPSQGLFLMSLSVNVQQILQILVQCSVLRVSSSVSCSLFVSCVVCIDHTHMVEYDPFIRSQLVSRNQFQGLM